MGDMEKCCYVIAAALGFFAVITWPLAEPGAHLAALVFLAGAVVCAAGGLAIEEV